jgi:hypothetical protein
VPGVPHLLLSCPRSGLTASRLSAAWTSPSMMADHDEPSLQGWSVDAAAQRCRATPTWRVDLWSNGVAHACQRRQPSARPPPKPLLRRRPPRRSARRCQPRAPSAWAPRSGRRTPPRSGGREEGPARPDAGGEFRVDDKCNAHAGLRQCGADRVWCDRTVWAAVRRRLQLYTVYYCSCSCYAHAGRAPIARPWPLTCWRLAISSAGTALPRTLQSHSQHTLHNSPLPPRDEARTTCTLVPVLNGMRSHDRLTRCICSTSLTLLVGKVRSLNCRSYDLEWSIGPALRLRCCDSNDARHAAREAAAAAGDGEGACATS